MADRVILTIGTKKGVFVADAAKPRRNFALRGPFGPGVPVYSTLVDTRGTPRIYASSCNPFFGMKVLRSTDMGKSFKETKSAPAFPKDDGRAVANIWSLEAGGGKNDVLRSDDHGHSWRSIAKGLPTDFGFPIAVHPHDPDTVYVVPLEPTTRTCPGGAPAVWRSENGGESWSRLSK